MDKQIVFLGGLPRSGSTLLCNLLNIHPDIGATPSSPLCSIVQNMRRLWSDDPFLLAQLDNDFDGVYKRLENSTRAFIETWSADLDKKVIIDKSRGWLGALETLRALYPDVKLIVTVRDLRNVFSSVERQHRKTLLLDFPDHMEHNIVNGRVASLFAPGGVIGGPLRALQNLDNIKRVSNHVFIWKYEEFLMQPQNYMDSLFEWVGVDKFNIDFNDIPQTTFESDSHYRMKYKHSISSKIKTVEEDAAALSSIPPGISEQIVDRHMWYYVKHYPHLVPKNTNQQPLQQPYNNNITIEIP